MKPTTLSLFMLAAAALAHSGAYAQQAPVGSYPSSCGNSFVWSYAPAPNGPKTNITAFSGNDFTVNNVTPGNYVIRDNSAMTYSNNTAVVGADQVLKATITCAGYSYKVTQVVAPIPECAAVNVGQPCGMWFKFSPSYYPAPTSVGFAAATLASYPLVPKCAGVSGLAPATIATGPSSGCFRRFWVTRVAAPQPPQQWVPILKPGTWVQNATPLNLTIGDQIAN